LKSEKRRLPRKNGVVRFVVTVSSPAASTHAGVTTRLKANKACQLILASFSFLANYTRDLSEFFDRYPFQSRDAPWPISGPKRLKPTKRLKTAGLTQMSPAKFDAEKTGICCMSK
jgi:hypothetical protein